MKRQPCQSSRSYVCQIMCSLDFCHTKECHPTHYFPFSRLKSWSHRISAYVMKAQPRRLGHRENEKSHQHQYNKSINRHPPNTHFLLTHLNAKALVVVSYPSHTQTFLPTKKILNTHPPRPTPTPPIRIQHHQRLRSLLILAIRLRFQRGAREGKMQRTMRRPRRGNRTRTRRPVVVMKRVAEVCCRRGVGAESRTRVDRRTRYCGTWSKRVVVWV